MILAFALVAGGLYLLGQDLFLLPNRWDPDTGTLFRGSALYCLALGLALLGSFAGMVGYSWAKGTLPLPGKDQIRPDPSYKGTVIIRFWYLLLPAMVLIVLAFLLADQAPAEPQLHGHADTLPVDLPCHDPSLNRTRS